MTELLNDFLTGSVAWGVLLTLAAFGLGVLINRVTGKAIFNPLLLGSIFVIIFLSVCNIPYGDYKTSAAPVSYLLLPATVALAVPLIAAHLYCFYFGILADDTPPVGLAAYAAAAIADTSPIATGIQGFLYDIRTAILPLMFIFNHDIILWGVDSVPEGIFLFFMTVLGCMSFASLTQGWFIAKNTLPDALLLACSTIIMLYPALLTGFFLPHDQRYWGYLIGIGIMGLLAYMQHARTTQTTEAAA